jgi:hypothetical protein
MRRAAGFLARPRRPNSEAMADCPKCSADQKGKARICNAAIRFSRIFPQIEASVSLLSRYPAIVTVCYAHRQGRYIIIRITAFFCKGAAVIFLKSLPLR